MTENEARQKWCPMVRVVICSTGADNTPPLNRVWKLKGDKNNPGNTPGTKCIASDCMMWRWYIEMRGPEADDHAEGFCGLAGKP